MTPAQQLPPEDASDLTLSAWNALLAEKHDLNLDNLAIQSLEDFLRHANLQATTRAQREAILDQAKLIFEHLYPHLPFKKELFDDAKPLEAIEEVRSQIDTLSETDFHISVLLVFSTVHDIHTSYNLPSPYRQGIAFLPFQMDSYVDEKEKRRYLVTKTMLDHPTFRPGAEIFFCDGIPIENMVTSANQLQPGANPAAVAARGLPRLTVRPLRTCGPLGAGAPPFTYQTKTLVTYIPPGSTGQKTILFPWGVATGVSSADSLPGPIHSISETSLLSSLMSKILWCRPEMYAEMNTEVKDKTTVAAQPPDPQDISTLPTVFDYTYTGAAPRDGLTDPANLVDPGNPRKRFGYLRIKSFGSGISAQSPTVALVTEFKRILKRLDQMAPDGLILDIRGNPGGDIQGAERMLQMLTPHHITPARFHFASTPLVLDLLRQVSRENAMRANLPPAESIRVANAHLEFGPWLEDADDPTRLQGPLTSGQPLTGEREANDTGQVYQNPVVLLIDAITYSAADIFAGGFQDHGIGPVAGFDPNTGGGGANVWPHTQLLASLPSNPNLPVQRLPGDAAMSLAIRRSSRVGPNLDKPVEDIGVSADIPYPRTLGDLLFASRDFLVWSCELLSSLKVRRIDVSDFKVMPAGVQVTVQTLNLNSLQFHLQGRTTEVPASATPQIVMVPAVPGAAAATTLRIEGFAILKDTTPELAAATTIELHPAGQRDAFQRALGGDDSDF